MKFIAQLASITLRVVFSCEPSVNGKLHGYPLDSEHLKGSGSLCRASFSFFFFLVK